MKTENILSRRFLLNRYDKSIFDQYFVYRGINIENEFSALLGRMQTKYFDEYDLFRLIQLHTEVEIFGIVQHEIYGIIDMLMREEGYKNLL